MVLAFIIYSFLLFLSLFCFKMQNSTQLICNKNSIFYSYIFIIAYTLIIGLRYDVGVDYLLYKETYLYSTYPNAGFIAENNWGTFEWGFSAFIWLFTRLHFHYCSLFLLIAFLQVIFLYIFSKRYAFMSVWIFYFYMTSSTFFDSLNIMRQSTAFFMFLCCLKYIEEKKLIAYLLSIACIWLFHRSIIIMLPFYFVANYKLFPQKWITASLIIISFLLSKPINDLIWGQIFPQINVLLSGFSDASYLEQRDDLTLGVSSKSLGLANYIMLFIDLTVIFYINNLRLYYKKITNIEVYYNLYIIGAFIYYLCNSSIALVRLNFYFVNIRFVMLSFLAYMLFHLKCPNRKMNNVIGVILILISLMWFINAILKGMKNAPFQFI